VDGVNVVRVIQEAASGQPARIPVDSAAVATRFPGPITDLKLSRDGTRAAIVVEGQVILASVVQTQGGQYALTYPRRLGFGLGDTAVSLAWRTGDDIVVTRTDAQHPVSYVNLDGVNSDGPSRNLLAPVTTVAANPSSVYVADQRGVLQLSGAAADGGRCDAGATGLTARSSGSTGQRVVRHACPTASARVTRPNFHPVSDVGRLASQRAPVGQGANPGLSVVGGSRRIPGAIVYAGTTRGTHT
jgi:hypothetical protein